jgi:hypothetical protein
MTISRGTVTNARASAGARMVEAREAVWRAKGEEARLAALTTFEAARAEYDRLLDVEKAIVDGYGGACL